MKAYLFITEDETSAFSNKVTKALNEGWELYGSPNFTFDTDRGEMRCGQAVVKEMAGPYNPNMKLDNL